MKRIVAIDYGTRRTYDAGIDICKRMRERKDLSELQQARMDLEDDAG